jgi:hypothetical protein
MTDLAQAPAAPPKRKGLKIMWALAGVLAVVAICGWIAFFVGVNLKLDKPVLVGILTVTALCMEGLMWTVAASIGVTVFETRKRIWRFLTGRGWTQG